jgi:hypothetical protein
MEHWIEVESVFGIWSIGRVYFFGANVIQKNVTHSTHFFAQALQENFQKNRSFLFDWLQSI